MNSIVAIRTAPRRAVLVAIALAALLLAIVVPGPGDRAHAATSEQIITRILDDTNALRAQQGKPPLFRNQRMEMVATEWSRQQAQSATMSHNPSYSQQIPGGWRSAAENVAYGYQYDRVVAAWRDSPGHFRNIMSDSTDIGIGFAYAANGQLYYTQVFAQYPASAQAAARQPALGTGAVSVKGPGSELIPGATIEIRKDNCAGAAVWRTTTGSRPSAYGAFGIGLAPGAYCAVTLAAPAPYDRAADVPFTMEARSGNWVTVWLPSRVTGAVVAKNSQGVGVNGVTALTRSGSCAAPGAGVWQNTTATNAWSTGGYGISLRPGTYCTTVVGAPGAYGNPAPVETVVTRPGPVWITLWMPTAR